MNKSKLLLFGLMLSMKFLIAQTYMLDTIKDDYKFINWTKNEFKFVEESPSFKTLFHKLNNVAEGKEEDVHIFHIGGSHIQADIYSNRLRTYLQNMNSTSKGQRGFVYPYKLAKTNNPSNYTITHNGEWKGYRCSVLRDSITWGMAGISAVFKDSISNLKIKANHRGYDTQHYDFNKIRFFYNNWSDDYEISLDKPELITSININNEAHFIEYTLTERVEELDFCVQKLTDNKDAEFLMMGLELMNDNKGIEYTTIGVNGASFNSYNRSAYFQDQLMLYKPDLFIVSVGTNDAYHPTFDPQEYKTNYENLILSVQKANPECAILLTVPNDSYYKRKIPNPRTRVMQSIIYDLAVKYKMAVWDFYEIMGGFNASQKWYQKKLMPKDRIHFTQVGYRIKADLLLEALVQSWEKELDLSHNAILYQIVDEK